MHDHDPFFYTAPNYRYNRDGTYYETNQYGVNLLRQAVNNGYAEAYNTEWAERMEGYRSSYQDS